MTSFENSDQLGATCDSSGTVYFVNSKDEGTEFRSVTRTQQTKSWTEKNLRLSEMATAIPVAWGIYPIGKENRLQIYDLKTAKLTLDLTVEIQSQNIIPGGHRFTGIFSSSGIQKHLSQGVLVRGTGAFVEMPVAKEILAVSPRGAWIILYDRRTKKLSGWSPQDAKEVFLVENWDREKPIWFLNEFEVALQVSVGEGHINAWDLPTQKELDCGDCSPYTDFPFRSDVVSKYFGDKTYSALIISVFGGQENFQIRPNLKLMDGEDGEHISWKQYQSPMKMITACGLDSEELILQRKNDIYRIALHKELAPSDELQKVSDQDILKWVEDFMLEPSQKGWEAAAKLRRLNIGVDKLAGLIESTQKPPVLKRELADLIQELGSRNFREREAASKELKRLAQESSSGWVQKILSKAVAETLKTSIVPEQKARAETLMSIIETRTDKKPPTPERIKMRKQFIFGKRII